MHRKLFAILVSCVLCFRMSGEAHASPYSFNLQDPTLPTEQPIIKSIKTGDKAPFDGVLLNTRAAAEIQAKTEQADARCEVKTQKEVQIAKAELQYKLDVSTAKELAAVEKNKLLEDISSKQRDLYTQELKSTQKLVNKRDWGGLYFAGGIIGGMLIVLVGAYAVKEIRQSP